MSTSPDTDSYTSTVTAGPGGAMTDEVGVITGDLTVRTTLAHDRHTACVTVQYTGADEWYTLTGSPALVPDAGLAAYHRDLLGRIRRGRGATAT
ncbi:hypothetical protein [Streptomyces sp. NPDC047841]|uniref:hypothetical protein n=1 Tax=Streptomyces sp. NPDC047841 TaxID=3154708 RepID=UPI003455C705